MAENPPYNDGIPPPYAPPPYPGPGDSSAQPQHPPPGQGYTWQEFPPPATEIPLQGGDPQDKPAYAPQPGYPGPYPSQPGNQVQAGNPGYPAQPGFQGYPAPPITTQQHNVTVVQGGPSVILAPQVAPPDYSGLAWFACLCCFCPIGICAIMKSNETRAAIYRGDMVLANQLSLETRQLANMSIGFGIVFIVIIVISQIAAFASA